MMTRWMSRLLVVCGALFALSGCGGGGGGGGSTSAPAPTAPPAAPVVNLGFGIKQLQFSWAAVSGASYYQLLENPNGAAGYSQVGSDITGTSVSQDIAIAKLDWLNASYIVQACNSLGCTQSNALSVTGDALKTIGYAKSPAPATQEYFGWGLALSRDGNTLAVGVPSEGNTYGNFMEGPGGVYVFTRSATGLWSQQAHLQASNPSAGDMFGSALAISDDGNTLAVGARYEDGSGSGINPANDDRATDAGAVYAFSRSNGTWNLTPVYIKAPDTAVGNNFGYSVALSGDGTTLAVGSPGNNSLAGAAYLYNRATAWSFNTEITVPLSATNTSNAGDQFGYSIALSDDDTTLAVGAPYEDSSTITNASNTLFGSGNELATDSGAVFVYNSSGGVWPVAKSYIKASDTGSGDLFGFAVALNADGTYLAVGAPAEDDSDTTICTSYVCTFNDNATDAGAAYLYVGNHYGSWGISGYFKPTNTGAGDWFGASVALSNDAATLVVGAPNEGGSATGINGADDNSAIRAGAAYLFTKTGTYSWVQQTYIKTSNTNSKDGFGSALSLSGDGNTLAVSAPGEDSGIAAGVCASGDTPCIAAQADNSAVQSGAVYLY